MLQISQLRVPHNAPSSGGRGGRLGIVKPRIIVHTTYFPSVDSGADPERDAARALGAELYDLLTRPRIDPLGWGAGVPVRIATRFGLVDPAEADCVFVVPTLGQDLADSARRRNAAIDKLGAWTASRAVVIPVLRSEAWLAYEPRMPVKPLRTEIRPDASRDATLEEIVLAIARELSDGDPHKLRVFISHAKGDLASTGDAAEKIRDHLQAATTAGKPFFDKTTLLPGEELDAQIDAAAEQGVFIAVRGDTYSSREWCLRELLKAKRRRLPMLTVEVLTKGERRSSAYSGNGPTITWDRDKPKLSASRVTRLAMVECVRHLLFDALAQRLIRSAMLPGDAIAIMPRAPELLDLPRLHSEFGPRELIVLHPDPELSVKERELLHDADKDLRLVTPTTAFAGAAGRALRAPLGGWQVALSLSNNPDAERGDGVTQDHIVDATVFLARALIGAGAELAYGGDYRADDSYTRLLIQLISAYKQTASNQEQELHSYIAAHLHRPDDWQLPYTLHHLGRDDRDKAVLPPPSAPPDRGWSALYFSDMRRFMELETRARVVLGGNLVPKRVADDKGYGGRYPGVIEETWRALEAGHPLYIVGGFGGAAGVVVDLIEGDALPDALDEHHLEGWPAWQQLVAQLAAAEDAVARLGLPRTQADMAAAIRGLARARLTDDAAARAWNGLDLAENKSLFRSRDPLAIASLVLNGLVSMRARETADKIDIEIVEGDLSAASDLDVLAFPTFANIPLDGAGAAIDRITGNAATRARDTGQLASPGPKLGVKYLYAAPLGPAESALSQPSAAVTAAAEAMITTARRHGFVRVGLVTFLGNTAASMTEMVEAMLRGLAGAKDMQLVWFERDPTRAALLATVLQANPSVHVTRVAPRSVEVPAPPRGKMRTLLSLLAASPGEIDATLLVPEPNGLAPRSRLTIDDALRASLVGDVRGAPPTFTAVVDRGKQLVRLLFGDAPARVLDAIGDSELAILHGGAESALPYETMTWDDQHPPPALRGGIVRHLIASVDPEHGLAAPAHTGRLGILVIVDPTGDLRKARVEGEYIARVLRANPERYAVTVLQGNDATVDAIKAGLVDPATDVVHYCGHAFYRGPLPTQSGLVCAGRTRLTLEDLLGLARVPRLAVFNACQAGRVRGDTDDAPVPLSFAEFFLRARVDAYVGTFWEVSDTGAALFAETLYDRLAAGDELGHAVIAGRQRLAEKRLPDWANYLLYGRSAFRLVRGTGLVSRGALAPPAPVGRLDGTTIVATWSFLAPRAPDALSVSATERFADGVERPLATARPAVIDRRETSEAGVTLVSWTATISLAAPAATRGFRLRPTEGDPIDLGESAPSTPAPDTTRDADAELGELATLLAQQPDRGREILARLMPSADPDLLLAQIAQELDPAGDTTRSIFPFNVLDRPLVDDQALARFVATYRCGPLDATQAASDRFQTKEDWARYLGAAGTVSFTTGLPVNRPLSLDLGSPARDMTYEIRPGEMTGDEITVGLFADNGNDLYASRAIAKQIVDAELPYAFHLGDVYYGGTQQEFRDYFADRLEPMLGATELFMITGNHEMYAGGQWYQHMVRDKRRRHPRQRQQAETLRLVGPGFQIIGLDTMFVDWNSLHMRLSDYANDQLLELIGGWLDERPEDLTVLMTTNEAWSRGSKKLTRLYRSLRETIAGRVDLWFWGNVHYAALYEPFAFPDVGARVRPMIASCIGHGGYPFYTQTEVDKLPDGVKCRWLETRSRFWPEPAVRPDVGLNGWCTMKLRRRGEAPGDQSGTVASGWDVELTYRDWVGRDRLRAVARRIDTRAAGTGPRPRPLRIGDIDFVSVEESQLASVGAAMTWAPLP